MGRTAQSSMVLNGPGPVHEQVAEAVRNAVREGTFAPNELLPSYRRLAEEYDVGVAIVRRAMDMLEEEGVIRREKRRGVFACELHGALDMGDAPAALKVMNLIGKTTPITTPVVRADYLEGYTRALEHTDVRMRFVNRPSMDDNYEKLFTRRVPLHEQGVILINTAEPPFMDWLRERHVPYVVQFFARYDTEGLPEHHSVYVNKTMAGFQAANHLIELGHERIGFIGPAGTPASLSAGIRVYEGYCAALQCAGRAPEPEIVINSNSEDMTFLRRMAKQWIERSDRPTAVMTSNDAAALAILQVAREKGVPVPEAFSVVGINNRPESAVSEPPLTTVSIPRRMLAQTAVELLLGAAAGRYGEPQRRIVKCQLIVRKTTCPPRL